MKRKVLISVLAAVLVLTLCVGLLVACNDDTEPKAKFTVTYTLGEYHGSATGTAPAPKEVEDGSKLTLPTATDVPAWENFTLKGWQAEGGELLDPGAEVTVTANITYAAQWKYKYDLDDFAGEWQAPGAPSILIEKDGNEYKVVLSDLPPQGKVYATLTASTGEALGGYIYTGQEYDSETFQPKDVQYHIWLLDDGETLARSKVGDEAHFDEYTHPLEEVEIDEAYLGDWTDGTEGENSERATLSNGYISIAILIDDEIQFVNYYGVEGIATGGSVLSEAENGYTLKGTYTWYEDPENSTGEHKEPIELHIYLDGEQLKIAIVTDGVDGTPTTLTKESGEEPGPGPEIPSELPVSIYEEDGTLYLEGIFTASYDESLQMYSMFMDPANMSHFTEELADQLEPGQTWAAFYYNPDTQESTVSFNYLMCFDYYDLGTICVIVKAVEGSATPVATEIDPIWDGTYSGSADGSSYEITIDSEAGTIAIKNDFMGEITNYSASVELENIFVQDEDMGFVYVYKLYFEDTDETFYLVQDGFNIRIQDPDYYEASIDEALNVLCQKQGGVSWSSALIGVYTSSEQYALFTQIEIKENSIVLTGMMPAMTIESIYYTTEDGFLFEFGGELYRITVNASENSITIFSLFNESATQTLTKPAAAVYTITFQDPEGNQLGEPLTVGQITRTPEGQYFAEHALTLGQYFAGWYAVEDGEVTSTKIDPNTYNEEADIILRMKVESYTEAAELPAGFGGKWTGGNEGIIIAIHALDDIELSFDEQDLAIEAVYSTEGGIILATGTLDEVEGAYLYHTLKLNEGKLNVSFTPDGEEYLEDSLDSTPWTVTLKGKKSSSENYSKDIQVKHGETIEIPDDFPLKKTESPTSMTFHHFSDGSNQYTTETPITSDLELEASYWAYATFDLGGCPNGTAPEGTFGTSAYSNSVTLPSLDDITWEMHKFLGWKADYDTNSDSLYQPGTSKYVYYDVTFTAQWKELKNEYTVTYEADGKTVDTQTVALYGKITPSDKAPEFAENGNKFDHWTLKDTRNNPAYDFENSSIEDDLTFVAVYYIYIQFSLEGGDGTVPDAILGNETTADVGELPLGEDITKAGEKFVGWYSDEAKKFYKPGEDYDTARSSFTFKAQYVEENAKFTITYKPGNNADGEEFTKEYEPYEDIKLPTPSADGEDVPNFTAHEGYHYFRYWTLEGDEESYYYAEKQTYRVEKNVTLVAHYESVLWGYVGMGEHYAEIAIDFAPEGESKFIYYDDDDEYMMNGNEVTFTYTLGEQNAITITIGSAQFTGTVDIANELINIKITYNQLDYYFGDAYLEDTESTEYTHKTGAQTIKEKIDGADKTFAFSKIVIGKFLGEIIFVKTTVSIDSAEAQEYTFTSADWTNYTSYYNNSKANSNGVGKAIAYLTIRDDTFGFTFSVLLSDEQPVYLLNENDNLYSKDPNDKFVPAGYTEAEQIPFEGTFVIDGDEGHYIVFNKDWTFDFYSRGLSHYYGNYSRKASGDYTANDNDSDTFTIKVNWADQEGGEIESLEITCSYTYWSGTYLPKVDEELEKTELTGTYKMNPVIGNHTIVFGEGWTVTIDNISCTYDQTDATTYVATDDEGNEYQMTYSAEDKSIYLVDDDGNLTGSYDFDDSSSQEPEEPAGEGTDFTAEDVYVFSGGYTYTVTCINIDTTQEVTTCSITYLFNSGAPETKQFTLANKDKTSYGGDQAKVEYYYEIGAGAFESCTIAVLNDGTIDFRDSDGYVENIFTKSGAEGEDSPKYEIPEGYTSYEGSATVTKSAGLLGSVTIEIVAIQLDDITAIAKNAIVYYNITGGDSDVKATFTGSGIYDSTAYFNANVDADNPCLYAFDFEVMPNNVTIAITVAVYSDGSIALYFDDELCEGGDSFKQAGAQQPEEPAGPTLADVKGMYYRNHSYGGAYIELDGNGNVDFNGSQSGTYTVKAGDDGKIIVTVSGLTSETANGDWIYDPSTGEITHPDGTPYGEE